MLDQRGPIGRRSTREAGCALVASSGYLGAEVFLGSDPDQSESHACEESVNSDDLAAQDKTTCIPALLPGISGAHLGPILQ